MNDKFVTTSESVIPPTPAPTALQGTLNDMSNLTSSIMKDISAMEATVFYEKPLTSSDASGAGRIVIPKAIAESYFPILENQSGVPVDAIDTLGNRYHLRFRFWINNQSRMYLLEGASDIQKRYNLRVSDVMIFAKKPDTTLVVAGRPLSDSDIVKKPIIKRTNSSGGSSRREQKRSHSAYSRPSIPRRSRKPSTREPHPQMHHELNPFLPPCDGVFRLLLNSRGITRSGVFVQSGFWTAVLKIKGEMYQAFFESQEDAITAFTAAGYGNDQNE